MDATSFFSLATLAWLSAQALPLVVWPSFVITLLATEDRGVTSVAVYFARALGLAQLALSLIFLVLSGTLPLHASAVDEQTAAASAPYTSAAVLLGTLYHSAAAFYSYGCYYDIRTPPASTPTAYILGCTGSSVLAALGLWCLLFGSGRGHISRRTGADKRTSGFPFRNRTAHERKTR